MKLLNSGRKLKKDTIIIEIKTELQVSQKTINSAENIFGIEERHETGKRMETKYRKQENKSKRK